MNETIYLTCILMGAYILTMWVAWKGLQVLNHYFGLIFCWKCQKELDDFGKLRKRGIKLREKRLKKLKAKS